MDAGVNAILVGTSLMAAKDIGAKIDELLKTVNRASKAPTVRES